MQGWTDIHHHLLYGLDDGPQSYEDMCRMLHKAAEENITCLVVTPHMQPGMSDFNLSLCQQRLEEARHYVRVQRLPLTLLPGAEIYYTTMTTSMLQDGYVPRLGAGWHVLVEFHPHVSFEVICRAAVHLANAGCAMVLAHAERYRCLRFGSRLEKLRDEYHIRIQVNAQTILSPRSLLLRRWINQALDKDLIDIVASDAHDMRYRPCTLGQCAQFLNAHRGSDVAKRLCSDNANALLKR